MKKIEFTPTAIPIKSILHKINMNEVIFNKDYQRNFIWSKIMKEELILTIFKNMPIGSILLWDSPEKKEIIDGLQRLNTILSFSKDEFSVTNPISNKIVKTFLEQIKIENSSEARSYLTKFKENKNLKMVYSKMPLVLRMHFDTYLLSIAEIRHVSLTEIKEYFVKVQNQEKLKGGEIIRALPDCPLVEKLNEFNLEELANNLSFNNNRGELLKMLVMYHGLSKESVSLNSQEKRIVTYAKNETKINSLFINRLKNLLHDFKGGGFNVKTKAELKLLFVIRLLTSEFEDIKPKILANNITNIKSSTKIIQSNDPDKQDEKIIFIKNNPDLVKVTSLLKGQHNLKGVKIAMESLGNILKNNI